MIRHRHLVLLLALLCAAAPASGWAAPAAMRAPAAAPIPGRLIQAAVAGYLRRPVPFADLFYAAPITQAFADPGLSVAGARTDAAHERLDLVLRVQNDPRLLPFLVQVNVTPGELKEWQGTAIALPFQPSDEVAIPATAAAAAILVQPGHPARLALAGSGFALTLRVMPLEPGREGQRVHVMNPVTHTSFAVEVIGPDQVRLPGEDQHENR